MNLKLIFFLSVLYVSDAHSAIRYWVGRGVTDNWNNTLNWSATSGGTTAASVPTTGDKAYFDGLGTGGYKMSCTVDVNVTVDEIRTLATFNTGIINQGAFTITVNSSQILWNAGTFNGGSKLLSVGPNNTGIVINGGTINIGTGGFKAVGPGQIDFNNGTISTTIGSFYTDKTFTMEGGVFDGGSATVKFRLGTFNFNGGTFNSTSTNLHFSSTILNLRNVGGWVHNNATVYFDSTNTTTMNFGTGPNVSVDFHKVIVNKTAASSAQDNLSFNDTDTLNVLTDFDIMDGQLIYATAAIRVAGNVTAQSAFSNSNVDFIFTGSNDQTLNLIGSAVSSFNGRFILRKENSSLLTLLSPVTLDAGDPNTFIIEGGILVTSAGSLLTLGDNTRCKNSVGTTTLYYVENDYAFVEGPMQKNGNDYFVFPLGSRNSIGGQKSAPISISGTTVSNQDLTAVGSFYAEYFPVDATGDGYNRSLKDASINNIQACEYWILDRVSGTAPAFVWVSYESFGHSCGPNVSPYPEKIHVVRWDGNQWRDQGHALYRQPYHYHMCSSSSISSFSPFTTGSIDPAVVLPITLTSFSGFSKSCETFLEWHTSSEINSKSINVQQSLDGKQFTSIAALNPKGAGAYSFITKDVAPLTYYRLQMADFDGRKELSDVISIASSCHDFAENSFISPNLGANAVDLIFNYYLTFNPKDRTFLIISDQFGRLVSENEVNIFEGGNSIPIKTSNLNPGLYYAQIRGSEVNSKVLNFIIY